jgi:hypothetical protein
VESTSSVVATMEHDLSLLSPLGGYETLSHGSGIACVKIVSPSANAYGEGEEVGEAGGREAIH